MAFLLGLAFFQTWFGFFSQEMSGNPASDQWCYYVIVVSQPCHDLSDEYILENNYMNMKKTANYWR